MIIEQKEIVNKAVANIRHGDKPVREKKTENEEMKDVLNKLIKTVENFNSIKTMFLIRRARHLEANFFSNAYCSPG